MLYAENNPADTDLTKRHLTRYARHINLELVHNADDIINRLPEQPEGACDFDVLLMDYRLPGLNALDILRIVREERRLDLPVVVVTGPGERGPGGPGIAAGSHRLSGQA